MPGTGFAADLGVRSLVLLLLLPAATVIAQEGPPADYDGPVAERPEFAAGGRFVYMTTGDGESRTSTAVVLEDRSPWEGTPAYRFLVEETGHTMVMNLDLNWMATLDVDGSELFSATPDAGGLSWPLWVGKRWRSYHTYHDRVQDRSWNRIGMEWIVEAFEEVTVPAGTFMAFRLELVPGENSATTRTRWYEPGIGVTVRSVTRRSRDHARGAGQSTRELMEFSLPE